ncbi:MAG: folate-binding protein YgfZ [Herminiimonas sp.]|nr:folate-binding protein YgfZ [Herminiimonas sp.]
MQRWMNFLEQQGACDIDAETRAIGRFASAQTAATPVTDFMTPLTDYGLIAATGADAATFLHNQLTNDVAHLGLTEARLAGYCTPKGRLLASFLMWKSEDDILLQLPRSLQGAIQKRLQMFVMRAKATLRDAADARVQIGLAGPEAAAVLGDWFATLPDAPYGKVDADAGTLIRLADTGDIGGASAAGVARFVWIAEAQTLENAWPTLSGVLQPTGADAWTLACIRAGVPVITLATQEKFVPQMINFEAVGGVNFQKGCYPGQEIVARSQYLGKLKRRMQPATVAAAAVAGMEVFSDEDSGQACGMVVNAAAIDAGNSACLVEIKLAALDFPVRLGAADGPLLTFQALPYALADAERPDLR